MYSQAFESIKEFVQVNIIDMKEMHCVKNIRLLYQSLIHEMSGDEFKDASPYSQNMEKKTLVIKHATSQNHPTLAKTT